MALDLVPDPITLTIGVDNDKILTAGPFTVDGAVIGRTNKMLRFIVKATAETADGSATVDIDSVNDVANVYGRGDASTGVWLIDLGGLLPVAGTYHYRCDLSASSSNATDRECVARGPLVIEAV